MFKNYLKIAFRNLLKNKGYTAINIGGLAVGLAGFILILLYVNYEMSYEKWNPNAANIYRIDEEKNGLSSFSKYTPYPLAGEMKETFPEIKNTSVVYPLKIDLPIYAGKNSYFFKRFYCIDSNFFKLFPYKAKYGSLTFKPGSIILTEETSKKLFGNINPVGRIVTMGKENLNMEFQPHYTVTAILKSPAGPSHLTFEALSWLPPHARLPQSGWQSSNVITYVSIKPKISIGNLTQKIQKIYQQKLSPNGKNNGLRLILEPITKIHLRSAIASVNNLQTVIIVSFLAILMLLIACINFTNLSIARSAYRAKEVGMKKVLGAGRLKLIGQFLGESFFQCLIALFLGLVASELLLPSFNHIVGLNLDIWKYGFFNKLWWEIACVLLIVTIVAGGYPAFFLSGYTPAKVLKGNYSRDVKGRFFRNSLLIFQFLIAAIFIMGLFVINKQIQFMKTRDLGFDPHQVISIKTFNTYTKPFLIQQDREKILHIPGIEYMAVANAIPGQEISQKNYFSYRGDSSFLSIADVSFDYFKTLDIKTLAGRTFSPNFSSDTLKSAVINESAVKAIGITDPVGKTIYGCGKSYTIIGVIKDYYNNGFKNSIPPTLYLMHDVCSNNWKMNMLLKINTNNIVHTLNELKETWPTVNIADPVLRYSFLDKDYGKLFIHYERLSRLFLIATILTIIIAIIGLLALAAFIAQQHTKEIAIRRILGASGKDIIELLNKDFIRLIIIANLISWPIIYILSKKWLSNFAYHIDTPFFQLIIATTILLLLTVIATSIITWRAAKANPVDALKYE